MAMITLGGCLTVLDRFHPKTWWDSVRASQASVIHYLGIMPPLWMAEPDSPKDRDHQIRFGFGAGIDPALHQAAEDRANDTRTLLAQQALQQLGEAAKAFLAAKGVSPEMADVLGAISQSPDLVAALGDPDVKALMQEPANLKALAGMLKGAAAQARAVREAANAPGVPTPEPAHQSAAG